MNCSEIKFNYIKEEEFLLYLDWLTRFKNPVNNLLRVSEKILTKNCIQPKYNFKKAEELSFYEKIETAKFIWNESVKKLLNISDFSDNKVKNFLIFEEMLTFNTDNILLQIKSLEYNMDNIPNDYKAVREYLFFPVDELINYFEHLTDKPYYLQRLIQKKNSLLPNNELFFDNNDFASVKLLFLVEGITEEKLLPIFAEKYGLNFAKCGIKLKAPGGKTHILKYYTDIRKLLKIPVFILLDADGVDITDDLYNILEEKDNVYLISKGEIEDILPHELIIRAINNYYSIEGNISESDLQKSMPMSKILDNLYKEKGFGEFHKAKFAQIIQDNILSQDDLNKDIRDIFDNIKNKLYNNLLQTHT